jgi:hypothetical protein
LKTSPRQIAACLAGAAAAVLLLASATSQAMPEPPDPPPPPPPAEPPPPPPPPPPPSPPPPSRQFAQCEDGLDNDGDSKIDYPADPGCGIDTDLDETDPPPPPPPPPPPRPPPPPPPPPPPSAPVCDPHATWGIDRIDQRRCPLDGQFRPQHDGTGVTIYVVDSGIARDHSEFGTRARFGANYGGDGIADRDCHGHGTHVAAIAAGRTYGVARNARVVAVRVGGCDYVGADRPSTTRVEQAIAWINDDHQLGTPAVVNISGEGTGVVDDVQHSIETEGLVYVVAVGQNAFGENGHGACNPGGDVWTDATDAIVVSSSDANDARQREAFYGPCVDVYAPGVNVTSAWPTVPTAGIACSQKDNQGPASTTASKACTGTSFAAPHVAGAAALYLQMQPNARPEQVERAIRQMATSDAIDQGIMGLPRHRLLHVRPMPKHGDGLETVGISRPAGSSVEFHLTNGFGGAATEIFRIPDAAGAHAIVGDWDGDGRSTPGLYWDGGFWQLSNGFDGGFEIELTYGQTGDYPVVGDWNGDGRDTIGVFRGGHWYLSDDFSGQTHHFFHYGVYGHWPVAGDWNKDGLDRPGVFADGEWHLNDALDGTADYVVRYGLGGDIPVPGDWDGDGRDTPGIHREGWWFLSNDLSGTTHHHFPYGISGDWPLTGDWTAVPG